MKTLYLVRHAKSSWNDRSLDDIDRPLNGRGKRDAPDMGRRLARQGHWPGQVIASPARRARDTARAICAELDIAADTIHIDEDLYFSGVEGMLRAIERADDAHDTLMLVGHNPTMTELANLLGDLGEWNMPTCAIAIIGFDMASWGLVRTVDGRLLGYDTPKGSGDFD